MSIYTVAPQGKSWHIFKEGRYFSNASSKQMAERICASLESNRTPSDYKFTISDLHAVPGKTALKSV